LKMWSSSPWDLPHIGRRKGKLIAGYVRLGYLARTAEKEAWYSALSETPGLCADGVLVVGGAGFAFTEGTVPF
jgi:hypothetical protein